MTIEGTTTIPDELLDLQMQVNTRIPLRVKAKLDAYIAYVGKPERDRPTNTKEWPTTIQGVFEQALTEFLAKHPLREKTGPAKTPVRTTKKTTRKATTKE